MVIDRIKIRLIVKNNQVVPTRGTEGSAGWDLKAAIHEPFPLAPGKSHRFPCGFAIEIPQGYFGLICPRSGLATKHMVTVMNAPGVIDSDYRGEMSVTLVNLSDKEYVVQPFERIGQMVLSPFLHVLQFQEVLELSDTERGEGGFGSTGRH